MIVGFLGPERLRGSLCSKGPSLAPVSQEESGTGCDGHPTLLSFKHSIYCVRLPCLSSSSIIFTVIVATEDDTEVKIFLRDKELVPSFTLDRGEVFQYLAERPKRMTMNGNTK